MWAKKVKANWVKHEDKNTRFFQLSAMIRSKHNEINKIRDGNGFWWFRGEGLEQVFVQEFKLQFTNCSNPTADHINLINQVINPCISHEHNNMLTDTPSNAEIWHAVKSIGALKEPGPDGIHASFYQECWELVGTSVCNMVKDFFDNNTSLKLISHTNIAIISKVENPEIVNNYRPISLCNVSYKIITKVMITRLKSLIHLCISPNQGAFAPGRSIQDNILIAHELFSSFNRKKGRKGDLAVKLDLERRMIF